MMLKNKLSAVSCYAYLLKKKHKDQSDIVEGLSRIEQAVADSVKIFEFARMYEQLGVESLTGLMWVRLWMRLWLFFRLNI